MNDYDFKLLVDNWKKIIYVPSSYPGFNYEDCLINLHYFRIIEKVYES